MRAMGSQEVYRTPIRAVLSVLTSDNSSGSQRGLRGDGDVRPGWGADFPESHFRVAEIRGDSLFLIKDSFLTFLIDREKSFRADFFQNRGQSAVVGTLA